jgi:NAD(P)H-flavin reductase
MNLIIAKKKLSENVVKIDIKASEIAYAYKPGHHVFIKMYKESKPLPVVISKADDRIGTISLFVHSIGIAQQKLAAMVVGDVLFDVSGPFGHSVEIQRFGTVVCAAGGVGIVPLYPIVEAMKAAGNKVIVILGASSDQYILLKDEMRLLADELIIMTDDGSLGREGMVTEAMKQLFYREKVDKVITSGPIKMIKNSSALTLMFNIPIVANLYSIDTDGNGDTGIYRVSVLPNSKYICVDGIDFNAFYPDFETMNKRMEQRLTNEYDGNQSYSKHLLIQY